ncbi:hypothetical protein [Paraburkholderia sp.]|uniref:hypothetical protein n=1 Tax=Paraburkholderia sp. TaxID=1926495 RepID=UPI002D59B3CD|nr:hypothetical protein [Paraburkholderia sp.]HZZ06302.1 hypothetical protein [Paraburkholderia sp.]
MSRPGEFVEIPGGVTAETLAWFAKQTRGEPMAIFAPGYDSLASVLRRAFEQASKGKGAERHAQSSPFEAQPMQTISELVGIGFTLGQAMKKAQEAQRLPHDAAIRELLGAINYIAGAVIFMERTQHG